MGHINTIVSSAGKATSFYSVSTVTTPKPQTANATSGSSLQLSAAARNLAADEAPDTLAPSVIEFSPPDGSSEAEPAGNITLKFNEAIQRGTGLITIKNAKTGKVVEVFDVARSRRVGIENDTLTIDPSKDLAFNTKYQITFAKGSVKDLAGNRFVGSSGYDFKTHVDNVAPEISSFNPPEGSTTVLPTSNIAIKFSEVVMRGAGLITLKNADTGEVVETFNAANSDRLTVRGNTVTLNPTSDLAYDTRYEVSVAGGAVKDLLGNAFAGSTGYSFKTRVDTVAPKVATYTPADGSAVATPQSNISVKFSEAIQRGAGKIMLREATTGRVVETFDAATSNRLSVDNDTLTIDPTKPLKFGTKYQVTFASGTVKDLVGNRFAGSSSYDFKTVNGVNDNQAPVVTGFVPGDGSSGVSTSTNISVVFSETVQRGTGTVQLTTASGTVVETFDVATSDRLSISGNTLTIDPTNNLANDTGYKLVFGTGTVMDMAGNDYVATSSVYDFRTTTAPGAPAPVSNFSIDVVYNGDPSFQTYFNQAAAIWQNVILGDVPDIAGVDDLRISANVSVIDGAGGVLGQAGPTLLRGGSYLPYEGNMNFDSADMANMQANGTLLKVIVHEMGHVLGLGTLWSTFGLNSTVGQYTGFNALSVYRTMSGNPAATFVPLETGGGSGTANAHWSESVFDTEVMTGYAEASGNMPLSQLTIGGLADLGYQVNYAAADAYTLPAPLQQQSGSLSLMA